MKTFFFHVAPLARLLPMSYLTRISRQKAIFPFYHLVSDEEVIHVKHLYRIRSVKEFERDLDFFLKEFSILQVADLRDGFRHGGFLISFDDGLSEFYHIAAPILRRKGIPAICFINPAFVDNHDLFFRYKASILINFMRSSTFSLSVKKLLSKYASGLHVPFDDHGQFLLAVDYNGKSMLDEIAGFLGVDFNEYLRQHRPYLSKSQIESLVGQGFTIGAHSMDHPNYADISLHEQIRQTSESLDFVNETFKPEFRLFSFPFTDYGVTSDFFTTIFDVFRPIADFTFGSSGLKKDGFINNIQRIPIEGKFSAENVIYGEYTYYLLKALINKNLIRR